MDERVVFAILLAMSLSGNGWQASGVDLNTNELLGGHCIRHLRQRAIVGFFSGLPFKR